jgi:hypothetical protein
MANSDLTTYEGITAAVLAESGMTRVAFESLTIEQRVYLVSRYFGEDVGATYEELSSNQLAPLEESLQQGSFYHEFKYINESTEIFESLSTLLNEKLPGIYNKNTRSFLLVESYKSMMDHLDKGYIADSVLNNIIIESPSFFVTVPSLGNTSLNISVSEVRNILSNFTKSITNDFDADETVLTESLALSLLDINNDVTATHVISNFNNISENLPSLGSNLVEFDLIGYNDNVSKAGESSFSINESKASELKIYSIDDVSSSGSYVVELDITKYDEGSLRMFLGGDLIYNESPGRGKISITATPGSSTHTALVVQSDDFKGSIRNISIRKIIS